MALGFDPFNDRLSRDIRNTMSEALLAALDGHLATLENKVNTLRHHPGLTAELAAYLESRLACYRVVLEQATPATDPDFVALLCWEHELFFEFHELLERRWRAAEGGDKEVLQGMIRAAGTFIHRQSGNTAGAGKMAARAMGALHKYHDQLPPGFAVQPLLRALADPNGAPPRFGPAGTTINHCHHSRIGS